MPSGSSATSPAATFGTSEARSPTFELAALVDRERNLVLRDLAGADAAFDAQAAGRKHEGLAVGLGFQRHRPHRADQAERDMDHIAARRQHDVGRRAALLADQFEGAGLVRPVRKHPPHQPAVDDRQVLAVARRQRQHAPGRRPKRPAARTTGGTAATVGCVNGAAGWGSEPDRKAAPDSSPAPQVPAPDAGGTGGGRSVNI